VAMAHPLRCQPDLRRMASKVQCPLPKTAAFG
jgi:hypothetical protein